MVRGRFDEELVDPEFPINPYPLYVKLRSEAPMYWSEELGYWFASSYNACREILSYPATFSNAGWDELYMAQLPRHPDTELAALDAHFAHPSMISADEPDHTRLRSLVNRAFTPRAVAQLRGYIEEEVDNLLDQAAPGEPFDLLEGLAIPLPISLFAHTFGMSPDHHYLLKKTSSDFTRFISNVQPSWSDAVEANASLTEFRQTLLELIRERRKHPQADLVSTIVSPDESGDSLNDDELLSLCAHLLIAGHETTTNLIASATVALTQFPEQLEILREDWARLPRAIEEVLRWETPLQRVKRMATHEVVVEGATVGVGDRIMVLVGSANRDPAVFEAPDELNFLVERRAHLAFGRGIHACVGSALARLEATIAIERLFTRFPQIHTASGWTPEWNPSLLRGLRRLEVQFDWA